MVTLLLAVTSSVSAQTSGYPELDAMVQITKKQHMDNTYNTIDLAGWTNTTVPTTSTPLMPNTANKHEY